MAPGRSFPPQVATCVFAKGRRNWGSHAIQFLGLVSLGPASAGLLALKGLGRQYPSESPANTGVGHHDRPTGVLAMPYSKTTDSTAVTLNGARRIGKIAVITTQNTSLSGNVARRHMHLNVTDPLIRRLRHYATTLSFICAIASCAH